MLVEVDWHLKEINMLRGWEGESEVVREQSWLEQRVFQDLPLSASEHPIEAWLTLTFLFLFTSSRYLRILRLESYQGIFSKPPLGELECFQRSSMENLRRPFARGEALDTGLDGGVNQNLLR